MKPFFLPLAIFLLLSCNQKKEEPAFEINRPEKTEKTKQPDLTGIFTLKTVNDSVFNMNDYYGFEATQPYMAFDTTSKIASGHSGCNEFTAPFEVKDQTISLTEPPTATEMGCEDGNTWENQFFQLLTAQKLQLRKNEVVVSNNSVRLVFEK